MRSHFPPFCRVGPRSLGFPSCQMGSRVGRCQVAALCPMSATHSSLSPFPHSALWAEGTVGGALDWEACSTLTGAQDSPSLVPSCVPAPACKEGALAAASPRAWAPAQPKAWPAAGMAEMPGFRVRHRTAGVGEGAKGQRRDVSSRSHVHSPCSLPSPQVRGASDPMPAPAWGVSRRWSPYFPPSSSALSCLLPHAGPTPTPTPCWLPHPRAASCHWS